MTLSAELKESDPVPPASQEPSIDERLQQHSQLLEIISAILLSIATLATSWSGYQASLWGGQQSTRYSQANALRVESTRAYTRAGQQRVADVVLFGNWLNAYAANDTTLMEIYEERFRAEFLPAFEAWGDSNPFDSPDALPSPFAHPEYILELEQQAEQQDKEATATFIEGQEANEISDKYVFNAVLMASVLFFGGIAQRFFVMRINVAILILATLLCIFGLYNVLTLPVL